MNTRTAVKLPHAPALDRFLLVVVGILLAGGLVMLTSASISVAERTHGDPFFYLEKQLVAVALGLIGLLIVIRIPTAIWERFGLLLAILAVTLLTVVLIPGFGHTVNGSTRWLNIGGVNLVQVSEPARLLMLLYMADYAVRRREELRGNFQGFLKPMLLVSLTCGLLLAEPDFGAAIVMLVITLAVLFVAGARWRHFLLFSVGMGAMLTMLALSSSYRLARITAFLDPWSDPYDSGFQLTQSLIAIGTGEWVGLGLGESVQKLFYLPEAHTDFVFAVIAEEFGLLGSVVVIALFAALVWRALGIARESAARERFFQAYVAFGFGVWQGFQALVNIGVNMGILPTKGLTLPLVSYGRSSLVITLIGLGLLLRIDLENRRTRSQLRRAER
ncbi:MAG: putative lipid II flippase FtsW [Gammaproteobacteria bacterium]|nr:putative lipid II flippase FtsW [Gammaproteobacteria bacterium]